MIEPVSAFSRSGRLRVMVRTPSSSSINISDIAKPPRPVFEANGERVNPSPIRGDARVSAPTFPRVPRAPKDKAAAAFPCSAARQSRSDRKSVVLGKSVAVRVHLGGRSIINKQLKLQDYRYTTKNN